MFQKAEEMRPAVRDLATQLAKPTKDGWNVVLPVKSSISIQNVPQEQMFDVAVEFAWFLDHAILKFNNVMLKNDGTMIYVGIEEDK